MDAKTIHSRSGKKQNLAEGNVRAVAESKHMLKLMSIDEIPAPGEHAGVFTKVSIKTGKDENNVDFKHLVSGVELDATDSTGKKFQLEKTYNINFPRGLTAFRNDYYDWSGRKLTDYELSKFDAEMLMNGKPVKLVVRHRKDGKKSVLNQPVACPSGAGYRLQKYFI